MTIPSIDIYNDVTPKLKNAFVKKPTMSELRAALKAADAATFTDAYLKTQTRNDLINAARVRNIAVATTL